MGGFAGVFVESVESNDLHYAVSFHRSLKGSKDGKLLTQQDCFGNMVTPQVDQSSNLSFPERSRLEDLIPDIECL